MTPDLYDALTLEVERADALAGLVSERLSDLSERPDAPSEIYALGLVADAIIDKLQRIRDHARALHDETAKTIVRGEDGRRPKGSANASQHGAA